MGELFESLPGTVLPGKDIVMTGCHLEEIFVSEHDDVYCYPGVLEQGDRYRETVYSWPAYLDGRHSTEKAVQKWIRGFIRIKNGCIFLDSYIDDNDWKYKKVDGGVRFPNQSDGYYGVIVNREENEPLTRAVFGFTYKEITALLESYARAFGWREGYKQYPRLTRSARRGNFCDLTGVWIPECFPYVTFEWGDYLFSHVSLFGFYRLVQLLTLFDSHSVFSQVLLKNGLEPELLKRLFDVRDGVRVENLITRRMVCNV